MKCQQSIADGSLFCIAFTFHLRAAVGAVVRNLRNIIYSEFFIYNLAFLAFRTFNALNPNTTKRFRCFFPPPMLHRGNIG